MKKLLTTDDTSVICVYVLIDGTMSTNVNLWNTTAVTAQPHGS